MTSHPCPDPSVRTSLKEIIIGSGSGGQAPDAPVTKGYEGCDEGHRHYAMIAQKQFSWHG